MKKLFIWTVFVFFIHTSLSYSQSLNNAPDHINDIKRQFKLKEYPTVKIYKTDLKTLEDLIVCSEKKYKVVYFFSPYCQASIKVFPAIKDYLYEQRESFDLFVISGHQFSETAAIEKYLKRNEYFYPMFILDTEILGNKKNPFTRLDLVSEKMCISCEHKKMGFSSYFVLDKLNKVVLHTNWNYSESEIINEIKKLSIDKL